MTGRNRFLIGGLGAMMPIFVTLLSLDYAAWINHNAEISAGHLIGFSIRYIILFLLGGVIAYLHEDEIKPYKLFQIGIAAPALVTSLVAANSIENAMQSSTAPQETARIHQGHISFSLIASANASESHSQPIVLAGFVSDIVEGVTGKAVGKAYQQKVNKKNTTKKPPKKEPRTTPNSPTAIEAPIRPETPIGPTVNTIQTPVQVIRAAPATTRAIPQAATVQAAPQLQEQRVMIQRARSIGPAIEQETATQQLPKQEQIKRLRQQLEQIQSQLKALEGAS